MAKSRYSLVDLSVIIGIVVAVLTIFSAVTPSLAKIVGIHTVFNTDVIKKNSSAIDSIVISTRDWRAHTESELNQTKAAVNLLIYINCTELRRIDPPAVPSKCDDFPSP